MMELLAVIFGLISVYLAVREKVLTWPTGIISQSFLIVLYQSLHLYSNMFLQIYLNFVCVYGWFRWKKRNDKKIKYLTNKQRLLLIFLIPLSIFAFYSLGKFVFPILFNMAEIYPLIGSFIFILSIYAVHLMSRKKIESWILWILVDLISVFLFLTTGNYMIALLSFVYAIMATTGLINWIKIYEKRTSIF